MQQLPPTPCSVISSATITPLYDNYSIPTALYVNFKATKTIGRYLRVAVFVNRIIDYLPDFNSGGLTVRRSSDAYFGMEVNVKI